MPSAEAQHAAWSKIPVQVSASVLNKCRDFCGTSEARAECNSACSDCAFESRLLCGTTEFDAPREGNFSRPARSRTRIRNNSPGLHPGYSQECRRNRAT